MGRSSWDEWRRPERVPTSSLYLVFGCRTYSAATTCGDVHHRRIPAGDSACCAVCHQSGLDAREELRETAADKIRLRDWRPDTHDGRDDWTVAVTIQPAAPRAAEPAERLTRRERRSRRWGRNSVPACTMEPDQLARAVDRGTARLC